MKVPPLPPGAVRAVLPILTIVAAVVAGVVLGIEISILVVASGALLGVVALLWASVQSLTGENPITLEEALGLGAPSAEEEQKRSVLRALKDLEYERSVGKISEDDYADLSARYREEAKRLMQSLDQSSEPARERVDKLVAERLAGEKRPKKRAAAPEPSTKDANEDANEDAPESGAPESASATSAPEASKAPIEAAESDDEAPNAPARAGGEST